MGFIYLLFIKCLSIGNMSTYDDLAKINFIQAYVCVYIVNRFCSRVKCGVNTTRKQCLLFSSDINRTPYGTRGYWRIGSLLKERQISLLKERQISLLKERQISLLKERQ